MRDCKRFVGEECEELNRWMDEYFREFGPQHRFKRHHREGVEEAFKQFGETGRRAALVHILRDCRHIPSKKDYLDGTVDKLGLIAKWPVSAYIRYPEEAFERLVMYSLNGPEAVLNLAFFRSEQDLVQLLNTQIGPESEDRKAGVLARWPSSTDARDKLAPLQISVAKQLSERQQGMATELFNLPLIQSIRAQFNAVSIGLIDASSLINPLVWVDLEYVEELRAELVGSDELDILSFAIPRQIRIGTRLAIDADGTGVSVVSKQKLFAVTPPIINQIPDAGFSVTFNVIATPQLILVSRTNGQFYLRNGIHRAFLLASTGVKEIPAVIVEEETLRPIVSAYPAFTTEVLQMQRPPTIADLLDQALVATIPLQRTQKVVRITTEEMILPVE
jgi:hypothetical protein